MPKEPLKFKVEDAEIRWPNFSGAPTAFNTLGGKRSFNVVLDKATADLMANDGWNVKCKLPDDENPHDFCFIEVTVGYKYKAPKIVLITSSGRTNLTEENVGTLDALDIKTVDMIARAYEWQVGDKAGITAYLQTMYVTIEEDDLDRKYAPKKPVA